LEHDADALRLIGAADRRVTSALTLAEANRGVVRARVAGRISASQERQAVEALQTFAKRCAVVSVTDAVLQRAGQRFPHEPIRTLDAIHMATIELLGAPPQRVTVLTRDKRVQDNAQALGYATA
jgi:predicted nucleic acid-binding protein